MKKIILILFILPTIVSYGQNIAYTVNVTKLKAKADACDGGLSPLCPNAPQDPVIHVWTSDAEANENTHCWIYDNDDDAAYNQWIDIQNLEIANETGVMTSYITIDMGGFESDELIGSIACDDWNGDAVMNRQLAQQFDLSVIPQGVPYTATVDIGDVYFAEIEIEWVDLNASLFDLGNSIQFKMAPNPTEGFFSVDLTEGSVNEFNLAITDLSGRTVLEKFVSSNKTQVNLNDQEAGVYFVRITTGDKSATKTLLLK